MTNHEIDRLLRRTAAGDKAAFAQLYEGFRMPVYYYALQLLGNQTLAEDVMQETFVSVLRGSSTYRHTGKASAWIFTIAKHKAIDLQRKEHPQLPLTDAEQWLTPVPDVAESVDGTDLAALNGYGSCNLWKQGHEFPILKILPDEAAPDVADESGFKTAAVEPLEDHLAQLAEYHFPHGI